MFPFSPIQERVCFLFKGERNSLSAFPVRGKNSHGHLDDDPTVVLIAERLPILFYGGDQVEEDSLVPSDKLSNVVNRFWLVDAGRGDGEPGLRITRR